MGEPLQGEDPRQVGAFRLRERSSSSAEGVVYAAVDGDGRAVSVAMLSQGAAADPAARDRFAAAVKDAGRGGVLASSTSGGAVAWVAVSSGAGGGDAARFLDPVRVEATVGGGPSYAPYWAGADGPASARWAWLPGARPGGVGGARSNRAVVVGLLLVVILLLLMLIGLYLFLSQLFSEASGRPVQVSPSPGQSPSSSQSASPSPSPSGSGDPSPSESSQDDPSPGESGEPSDEPSPTGDVPSVPLDPDFTGDPGVGDDPSGLA